MLIYKPARKNKSFTIIRSTAHSHLLMISAGKAGDGCSERIHFQCNFPKTPELPYGRWVVSICPTHCDTTRAMCFCGEGTKYPNRPVAEACGFHVK